MYAIRSYYALQCEAAVDTSEYLARKLPGVKVGLVHGRMKAREKERAMAAFRGGEIQLLVVITSYSIHYTKLYEQAEKSAL